MIVILSHTPQITLKTASYSQPNVNCYFMTSTFVNFVPKFALISDCSNGISRQLYYDYDFINPKLCLVFHYVQFYLPKTGIITVKPLSDPVGS